MRRTRIDRNAEEEGKPVQTYLSDLYEKFGSQVKVAANIGISQGRLSQFLKEKGLKEKTILVETSCTN